MTASKWHRVLVALVRYRIVIAACAYLVLFGGIVAIGLIFSDKPLAVRTEAAPGDMAVTVRVSGKAEAMLESPVTVLIVFLASVAIIGWVVLANIARKRLIETANETVPWWIEPKNHVLGVLMKSYGILIAVIILVALFAVVFGLV